MGHFPLFEVLPPLSQGARWRPWRGWRPRQFRRRICGCGGWIQVVQGRTWRRSRWRGGTRRAATVSASGLSVYDGGDFFDTSAEPPHVMASTASMVGVVAPIASELTVKVTLAGACGWRGPPAMTSTVEGPRLCGDVAASHGGGSVPDTCWC